MNPSQFKINDVDSRLIFLKNSKAVNFPCRSSLITLHKNIKKWKRFEHMLQDKIQVLNSPNSS